MKKLQLLFLFGIIATSLSAQADLAKAKSFMSKQFARFEENKGQIQDLQGQAAPYVHYHYTQGDKHIFMLPTGIAYQFNRTHYPEGYKHLDKFAKPEEQEANDKLREQIRLETYRMDMELVGANPNAKIMAEERSADYINYYNKNALDVHSFQKLTYQNIYPNIDWVIYSNEQGLKYDFVVRPGGNPAQIRLQFKNHENLKLNADGSFTLSNRMGTVSEEAPVSFQDKKAVPTRFVLEGDVIFFDLANYNPNQTLVIDPNLEWATYYGGSNTDIAHACAIDAMGNVYLAGRTNSSTDIAFGGHQNNYSSGLDDAFLVKFDSMGIRQWGTYYGGTGDDSGNFCALDTSGNVYLAGQTTSISGIAFNGHQNTLVSGSDAFLAKFNYAGTLQWGTYYGGMGSDFGNTCSVDAQGNIYLAGTTSSSTNIAFNGYQNSIGGGSNDAFIAKFNSLGIRQWGTYYGGTGPDEIYSCVVDIAGNVFFSGNTQSASNIASGGHQNNYSNGLEDAFLVKLNSNGVRQWGTYYGGLSRDFGNSCSVDNMGNIYLSGSTGSTDSIAFGGHQNFTAGNADAFLVKFNNSGVRLWGTYYGGTGSDEAKSCTVDNVGNVYLAGYTWSYTNIAIAGYQDTIGGGNIDAFLVKFNNSGVRLWGTYFGGEGIDEGTCVGIAMGKVYLAGGTNSATNIAFGGHQNGFNNGNRDAFLVKFQNSCFGTSNTITQSACDSFSLNSQTYTTSGTYTQVVTNAAGCDSTITLNLTIGTISSIDTSITANGSTLTANETGASYQWLDCNNANQPIAGEIGQSFTPQQSGSYAVQITKNGCTAISNCYQVQGTCAAFSINFTVSQTVPFEVSIQPYINGSQPTNNISLNWDFGDGTPLTAQNPAATLSHLYAGNGPYNLCMYVIDSTINCSGTYCDTIEINAAGLVLRGSAGFSVGAQPVIFNGAVPTENISASPEMNISLFPNPATNQTTVAVELPTASDIRIRLINSLGQVVQTAEYSEVLNIQHRLQLSDLPAAIYLVEISANGFSKTQRLVILRK